MKKTRQMQCGNRLVTKAMDMAKDLRLMADRSQTGYEDDGCAVLCGLIRDCAFKIQSHAEKEREIHRSMGFWKETDRTAARTTRRT